jgi:protein-disulfide isomerase
MRGAKDIIQLLLAGMAFVLSAAVAAWLFFHASDRPTTTFGGVVTDLPQAEFERRLRTYVLDHPEIIVEAMQKLEARQRAVKVKEVLKARWDEIFRDPASPISGNPDGDVSLVEFFDYNCPYCRQVTPLMAKAEVDDPPSCASSTRSFPSSAPIPNSRPKRRLRPIGRASTSPSIRRSCR